MQHATESVAWIRRSTCGSRAIDDVLMYNAAVRKMHRRAILLAPDYQSPLPWTTRALSPGGPLAAYGIMSKSSRLEYGLSLQLRLIGCCMGRAARSSAARVDALQWRLYDGSCEMHACASAVPPPCGMV